MPLWMAMVRPTISGDTIERRDQVLIGFLLLPCAAMNPVDHPHGGGEAKAGQGNPHPVSPWGTPAKGYKTRNNKRTQKFIVRDRRG